MPESPANEPTPTTTLRPPCRELPPRQRRGQKAQPKAIVIDPKPRRSGRGERMLTVGTAMHGDELRPVIRLRGLWLAELGFRADARIAVSEEQGRLVLTLAAEE
jgi:hypothetical protein